jgi:hypothetical protein
VQQISRVMHITITFFTALTVVITIYLTAYVRKDDPVLADLNGVGVPGTLTQFSPQRTCFINLSLLMGGSLVTVVKKNLSDNSYFVLVEGNVLRREILEVESLSVDPDGHHDLVGHNSLVRRLSHHQLSDNHCLETSENGGGGVEMQGGHRRRSSMVVSSSDELDSHGTHSICDGFAADSDRPPQWHASFFSADLEGGIEMETMENVEEEEDMSGTDEEVIGSGVHTGG